MPEAKFWMVVGSGVPFHKHYSKREAEREAERLARSKPGQSFTVVESLRTVVTTGVTWTDNSEIPF